jgi:type I restriction enzyme S subunit
MERYSSYKDSNVSWIGMIPEHWGSKQLRSFLTLFTEKGHGEAQLLSVTREQGVIERDIEDKEENHNFVPEDLSGYKYIEKGDFAINKMKAWQGSYAVSDYCGIVSPAYFTCKLQGVNKQFFSRAIRSKAYIPFFTQYSKGIRVGQWDLNPNALKSIPFFLPPLSEQEKIVSYLESKTSKIDAYVEDKEKEIELLQELKQKTIADAVTKGLNTDAKMKDSGISWIGEIPEHWEQYRFATLFKEKSICNHINEELLSVYLDRGVIKFSEDDNRRTNPTSKDLSKYQLVDIGDFVLNNQQAWRGSVGVSRYRGIISPAYFIFEMSSKLNPLYANYLLRSTSCVAYYYICSKGIGSIQRNLDWSSLKQKKLAIPSLDEQHAIVIFIEEKCEKIDKLASELQSEIDYLKEYKQRLIADCVTGQVNVQNEMI